MSADRKANNNGKRSALIQEENITTGETAMDIDVADGIDISGTKQENKNKSAKGLEADRIIAVSQTDGNLMFLVAWKNSTKSEADLVNASVVYRKWPLLALAFFKEALDTSLKDGTSAMTNKQ